ncbi:MAG TPA: hypothetical protein VNM43_03055 [Dehalococcoidia bacterium]|nr:hypothetical protein [Dehalococcoidia bacterium]
MPVVDPAERAVPVLHVILMELKPGCDPAPLLEAARALRGAPGALDGGAVRADAPESTHDAALWVLLPDRGALDAFGASEVLMRFLRDALAPTLARMDSGDFEVPGSPAAGDAALVFAAQARHGVFAWEWERAAATLPPGAAAGASAGDRSRFDFGGVITFPARLDLDDWLVGWPGELGPLASSLAWVAGRAERWEAAP